MRSIRQRLTIWLLGGLALLWLGAGAGIYHAVKQSLLKSLDAELAVDSRIVRFVSRGEDSENAEESMRKGAVQLRERMPAYHDRDSGVFFQIWTGSGDPVERSASLGDLSLPLPATAQSDPRFASERLADGRKVRTMSFRASSGSKGKGKGRRGSSVTVLAKETREMEQTLRSLVTGICVVGLFGALGAILLVQTALKFGLKPLTVLGGQAEAIDAGNLDVRFETEGLPTELAPISEQLNQLLQRLEASFERERRFSSDLAHEIRTPIAELKTMSEVALKWPDQAGAKTHAEALDIACQLESMVETLLALARWESGEQPLKEEPVTLADFLGQSWEPYSRDADERKLETSWNLDESEIQTDRSLLQHIITNLYSNAVEYTPAGGCIEVTALSGSVRISNSAPGLASEDVERLFDRYWRGDSSRSDSSHAGLGLALAKACAKALGFTLSADLDDDVLCFALAQRGIEDSA